MLKVAVVTNYFPTSREPWQGHSAYQTMRVLSTLCDVHVFCAVATYPAVLRSKTDEKDVDLSWNPADVKVTYVPFTAIPVLSRPFNGSIMARQMLSPVQAFAPDIILNYVIYPPGFAAVLIGRELRVPVILTAIGSDLNRISDALTRQVTRKALCMADFVTTVSHDLCATAIRLGSHPGKTRAILNGCDTSVFHPRDRQNACDELGVNSKHETIVYVGRLDLRKGLIELIESVSMLRERHPLVRCYIIGNGPARQTLLDGIETFCAGDLITLVPACSTETVALWMAASTLVTLPSYNEGCPNVIIEALNSGRPVVSTKVGGIPELVNQRSGRLVSPREVPALVTAFDEVLTEAWDAEAISKSCRRSWLDVAHDLFQIFKELPGGRAKPNWK